MISLGFRKAYVEMKRQISTPLGLSVEAAATGIIKIASQELRELFEEWPLLREIVHQSFLLSMVGPDHYVRQM